MNDLERTLREVIEFAKMREKNRIDFVDLIIAELNRRINNG